VNGYIYLSEAVRRRLHDFAAVAADTRDANLTTRWPDGARFAEEAVGAIVLNIGHGLADAHGRPFEIRPFLTLEATAQGLDLIPFATIRNALRTSTCYEDPFLLTVRPGASKTYWSKRLDVAVVEVRTITAIVEEFAESRVHMGPKLDYGELSELAETCVRAFFTALVNGVVARKSVRVEGFGTLSPGADADQISFTPDRRIVMAAEFDRLRTTALPAFKRTRATELLALEDEPAITNETLLHHAEKSLPASFWSRSRHFFRLALGRKDS
jgi:hypothetical protein